MSFDPDDLYTLRNHYWLGNYQGKAALFFTMIFVYSYSVPLLGAINEANTNLSKLKDSNLLKEKEELVYRSYLALGQYNIILDEIKDTPTTSYGLKGIKLLATYLTNPSSKDTIIATVSSLLVEANMAVTATGNSSLNTLATIAAILHMHDDNVKEAIKCVHKAANLEQHALLVQLYIRIDRADVALKQVKTMKSIDEDNVLTMLASSWVNLATGGSKVQEAAYVYDELIDKYGGTCLLLNGLAACKMHSGQFDEAESLLNDSLTKSQNDVDTLANLIVVSQHLNRTSDIISRYINQLKAKNPSHALLTSLGNFESSFDRVAQSLKI